MDRDLSRKPSRGPAETILSAANSYGPVAESLVAALDRKDLGRLRASCRDGRALVSNHLTHLELVYFDRWQLVAPPPDDASDQQRAEAEAGAEAAEAAQTSHWPALLAAFPACTDLTIRIGPWGNQHRRAAAVRLSRVADLGELLLGPFAAAAPSDTAARVTRLRLAYDHYYRLDPPASLPRLISCAFPALTHLQLDGDWADSFALATRLRAFYSALAEHLPRLQALQLCFYEGLEHVGLLAASMGELRQLTLGSRMTALPPAMSSAALGSFQQLRELRLRGYVDSNRGLHNLLQFGLADTLEHFELSDMFGPYLTLSAAVKAAATGMAATAAASTRGGSEGEAGVGSVVGSSGGADGGGGKRARRQWDVALHWGPLGSWAAADAVAAASLSVRQLSFRDADVEASKSPLLQRCRQVDTGRLRLEGDADVRQLGEVLQRLGCPGELFMSKVRRRGSLAGLVTFAAAGGLLAARLRRLEFIECSGLTPAGLIATLTALPLCEEVLVQSCPRVCTEPQYRSLVQQLLEAAAAATREGEALRGRRGRIQLDGRLPVGDRPLEGDESEGEEERPWTEICSIPQPLTAAMVRLPMWFAGWWRRALRRS